MLVQQTSLIGYLRSTYLINLLCYWSTYVCRLVVISRFKLRSPPVLHISQLATSCYCSIIVLDRSEYLTSPYIAHCVLCYWILFFVNLKSASSSTSSHLIRRCHRIYVVILFRFILFSVWTLFVFISSFQLFPCRIIYVYLHR